MAPAPGTTVGMHGQSEVGEPAGVVRHDEDLCSHPLQDLHLPYDDGAAPNDEPALVATAESACGPARQDGGGDVCVGHDRIMTEARVGRLLAACLHQAILGRAAAAARLLRDMAQTRRAARRRSGLRRLRP